MIPPKKLPVVLRVLQAVLSLFTLVSAGAMNYSVKFDSTDFSYDGSWNVSTGKPGPGNLDASGGHMLTNDPGASATITYNFSSVYILSAKWPYSVSTDYSIDGNKPFTIDMWDTSVNATDGGNASTPGAVVGNWPSGGSKENQQHTIKVTLTPNASYAVVDEFMFEVLDTSTSSSDTSTPSTQATSVVPAPPSSSPSPSPSLNTTSAMTSTEQRTGSLPSSSFSASASAPSTSFSPASASPTGTAWGSHVSRDLAISVSIVGGTLLALLVFLLWRFCIRRRNRDTDGLTDPITSHYHAVPAASGSGTDTPNSFANRGVFSTSLRDNSVSSPGSDVNVPFNDNNWVSINDDLRRPRIAHNYDPISSNNGPPSTSYTNEPLLSPSPPSSPLAPSPIAPPPSYHRLSTFSTATGSTMNSRISTLDESIAPSSSSGNRDIYEKSRNAHLSSQILRNTVFTVGAESQDEIIPTAVPEKRAENDSVWDSGYPQPLKFRPIL